MPDKRLGLTVPDMVLLSLLAEQPMHGYQANLELERRQVRDWAGVSRPQVYYSLEKLARLGLVREAREAGGEGPHSRAGFAGPIRSASFAERMGGREWAKEPALGPERKVYSPTAKGRAALAAALEREDWTAQRERPPFLTWMALSWQARPKVVRKQLERRREFLRRELAREEETLAAVSKEVGHPFHEAVWMITLVIEQFRTELRWLEKVEDELARRKPALHPARVDAEASG